MLIQANAAGIHNPLTSLPLLSSLVVFDVISIFPSVVGTLLTDSRTALFH